MFLSCLSIKRPGPWKAGSQLNHVQQAACLSLPPALQPPEHARPSVQTCRDPCRPALQSRNTASIMWLHGLLQGNRKFTAQHTACCSWFLHCSVSSSAVSACAQ